jgi:transposase
MTTSPEDRIVKLEDDLKQRDRRIADLRQELDEARDLVHRMEEHADDYTNVIEQWKEAFGMVDTGNGWTWEPFWNEHNRLVDDYIDLVRRWNKVVPLLNQNSVGRPLAASEVQQRQVLKLHKAGKSLRSIAEDMNLGLSTVRTIVDKKDGTDRTTSKHRSRIDIAPLLREHKIRRRAADRLPQRAQAIAEEGRKLIREAKGLGR